MEQNHSLHAFFSVRVEEAGSGGGGALGVLGGTVSQLSALIFACVHFNSGSLCDPVEHTMERSKYEAVQAMVKLPMSAIPHFKAIAHHFGVSLETVYSIYSQEVQNRVKETNHRLKELWPGHAKRYTAGVCTRQSLSKPLLSPLN